MKLKFLGSGSAFTLENYQSNMLITSDSGKHLLIDCGTDARMSLKEAGLGFKDIDAVYVSHLHSDHIGGLEWLGFTTFFSRSKRPKMFLSKSLEHELWLTLAGGMRSLEGQVASLQTYFEVHTVGKNGGFLWEGVHFQLVQVVHVVSEFSVEPAYGLLFTVDKKTYFLTTDTQFCPNQIKCFYDKADIVFHDSETSKFKSGVHANYQDLVTLRPEDKAKMWLYHYQDGAKPDCTQDGFRGWVTKGQEFVL